LVMTTSRPAASRTVCGDFATAEVWTQSPSPRKRRGARGQREDAAAARSITAASSAVVWNWM
jgi:hypothetical protein